MRLDSRSDQVVACPTKEAEWKQTHSKLGKNSHPVGKIHMIQTGGSKKRIGR